LVRKDRKNDVTVGTLVKYAACFILFFTFGGSFFLATSSSLCMFKSVYVCARVFAYARVRVFLNRRRNMR
jgi:hypothetical protein